MTKIIWRAISLRTLVGCAGTTQVVPAGSNTYMIAAHGMG
jgi:hypothetical protein